jgi:hypothetical protein
MHARRKPPTVPLPDFEKVELNNVMLLKLLKDVKVLMATSTGEGSDLSAAVENLTVAVDALTLQVNLMKDQLKFIYDNSYIVLG